MWIVICKNTSMLQSDLRFMSHYEPIIGTTYEKTISGHQMRINFISRCIGNKNFPFIHGHESNARKCLNDEYEMFQWRWYFFLVLKVGKTLSQFPVSSDVDKCDSKQQITE